MATDEAKVVSPEPQLPGMPEPPKKTCKIEQVLSNQTITLLKTAPENDVNRTLALAVLKKPLPEEAKTFEQIKEWVEANFKPLKYDPNTLTPKASAPALLASYTYRQTDHGTCKYSRTMARTGRYSLSTEDIDTLIAEANEDDLCWSEFASYVGDFVKMKLKEHPPVMGQETIQTTEHSSSMRDDPQVTLGGSAAFVDELYNWLYTQRREALRDIENR